MIIRVTFILLATLLAGCASTPKENLSNDEITDAEHLGRTLYEAITSEDGSALLTSREADLVRMIEKKGIACEGTYKAVSIFNEQRGVENLFLVLFPDSKGVQFGRHFRFRFKSGTNDMIDVIPSTRSCLLVPVTAGSIPFVTHLLSEVPDEFHVFLSLLHKREIYVSTSKGLWSIKNGNISYIKK